MDTHQGLLDPNRSERGEVQVQDVSEILGSRSAAVRVCCVWIEGVLARRPFQNRIRLRLSVAADSASSQS